MGNTDAATGFEQHGFVNVLVAVAAALEGADASEASVVLADPDGAELATTLAAWPVEQAEQVRSVFRSIGTCSIDEPVSDLAALGLPRPPKECSYDHCDRARRVPLRARQPATASTPSTAPSPASPPGSGTSSSTWPACWGTRCSPGRASTFMAQGYDRWVQVRAEVRDRLAREVPDEVLFPLADVTLHLPVEVADYVDFRLGAPRLEPGTALPAAEPRPPHAQLEAPAHRLPRPGGHDRRVGHGDRAPHGQRKGPDDPAPVFGPSVRLDIEAELGFIVGTGSALGDPIPVEEAGGTCSVSCCSTTGRPATSRPGSTCRSGRTSASRSPPPSHPGWCRCSPCRRRRCPRRSRIRGRCPTSRRGWGLDVDLEVTWNGEVVTRPPYGEMYWSPAQMLAHLTVNGASTRTGDLFASGTISGPEKDTRGAFIELTWGGTEPVQVAGSPAPSSRTVTRCC